jgi:hypothetical protein
MLQLKVVLARDCCWCSLQAMAAAITLKLAAACEELGLVPEAAAWLEVAAPDNWPSAQQQQAAAQQVAVQQLASQVIAAAGVSAGAGQDSAGKQVPQHAAFLVSAAQQADPGVLQAWASNSNSSPCSCSTAAAAAVRRSSSQGAWRPASASRMQLQGLPAGSAAGGSSAVGEEATLGCKAKWLRPVSQQECLLGIAQYLVDHAQYTPAVRLCATALQLARYNRSREVEDAIVHVHMYSACCCSR